jgi:transposase InsO family protein
MEQRAYFMLVAETGEVSFAALCRQFGISRDTGYRWLRRWRAEGGAGLVERSRAPRSNPRAVAPELLDACLALRRRHPTWGPVKVKAALTRQHSGWLWPAASTIGELFAREGLTARRKRRRRTSPGGPLFAADAPNDVWSLDFKGWFRTGDGARCETLTLADACSRYLLRCQAVAHPDTEHVWPILGAAFREYGLPLRLRSDNGPPFATTGAGGLSRLSVLVIKAGVLPERIAPGKPQENGRLERLHLTLLQDTASPPAATLRDQAKRFQAFRRTYNEDRPHAALDNATPAERHAPSPRRWDGRLRSPELEADATRRVKDNGLIKWGGRLVYISKALGGEPVALTETDGDVWTVHYGPILLGTLADRGDRLIRPKKEADGVVDKPSGRPQSPQPHPPQTAGT